MALTHKFNEIYPNFLEFETDANTYLSEDFVSSEDLELIYVMFYYKFAEQSVAFRDPNLFKSRFWLLFAMRVKNLLKRKDIMDELRELSLDDLMDKGVSILNAAQNPNTAPNSPFEVLPYVTSQTSAKSLNPKIVAFLGHIQSLDDTFWDRFFDEFDRKLFLQVFGGALAQYILWENE